ncbi:MAG: TlpA family protein disulfide reductase [Planctomycetaceae bacterium]|nr:TlpA family protein disulfide reductase [Planctomycetaceae bacterium]
MADFAPIHTSYLLRFRQVCHLTVAGLGLCAIGCGQSGESDPNAFHAVSRPEDEIVELEVVDLEEVPVQTAEASVSSESEIVLTSAEAEMQPATKGVTSKWAEGTPEWLLLELTKLNASIALDRAQDQLTPKQHRALHEVIDLATEVIAKTHQDASREQLFNNAVDYLADARMQLAIHGDQQQGDYLSQEADALFDRDPTSFAAVESATSLLQLTQSQAEKSLSADSKWVLGYARQARLFAEKFPLESGRAGVHLLAAARNCDQVGQMDAAAECLAVIQDRFPESPFAEQSAPLARRVSLPGQPLVEFGGSTFDGGFLTAAELRGKPLLIAFWSSQSQQFRADLPVLEDCLRSLGTSVTAVGVNLDRDDQAVQSFLDETGNTWKHIFFSSPGQRGEHNPLATYYAVRDIPTYWLVDADGTVRTVNLQAADLRRELERTLGVTQ